jgi:uncharacterized protein (TIGR03435 family)
MFRIFPLFLLLVLLTGPIATKSEPPIQAQATFEVASIKPIAAGPGAPTIIVSPGGRFSANDVTLKRLIRWAYNLQDFQIMGGPGWMATDKWAVTAKPENPETHQRIREMLQGLLEDRFKLKFSRATKDVDVFALVVAKSGSKLREVDKSGEGPSRSILKSCVAELTFPSGASMGQLVNFLSGQRLERPVIDQTGLTGVYDFALSWTPIGTLYAVDGGYESGGLPPPPPPFDPNLKCPPPTSIANALQEQLGLKLEGIKSPIATINIDHVEKPAPNER